MFLLRRPLLLSGLVLALAVPALALADIIWSTSPGPGTFTSKKKLTVVNTNVDADLSDFPLLVKVTADTDLASIQADGDDIRFTTATGANLPYEREEFHISNGSGSGIFWVKVPRIASSANSSSGAQLYMLFGSGSAVDGQNASGVWDSNFKGVWHLNQTSTGALSAADSTSNANHGINNGVTAAAGQVDGAGSFDGASGIVTENNISLTQFSCSVWVKPSVAPLPHYQRVMVNNNSTGFAILSWDGSNYDVEGAAVDQVGGTQDAAAWHAISVVRTAGGQTLYFDGAYVNYYDLTAANTNVPMRFGTDVWDNVNWTGLLDEPRISSVARDAAWIKFEYANMNDPAGTVTFGSSQTKTWDGGGADNNWSTAGNWSDDVAPTASDIVMFDGTSGKDVTIDANISIAGVRIDSTYTGTITQAATKTITVGASGWTQAGGTFAGGDSAITFNDDFTLSGGTFTATSGNLTVTGNVIGFSHTGGTFNANGGTFAWNSVNSTIDVNVTDTFNNFTVNTGNAGWTMTIGTSDVLTVTGQLRFQTGMAMGGTIQAQGTISIDAGFGTAFGGGTTIVLIDGTADQSFAIPDGCSFPSLTLDNPNTTVSFAPGANASIYNFTLENGTFMPSTGTTTFGASSAGGGFITHTGGTFARSDGTVVFAGPNSTVDFDDSEYFTNVTINTGHPAWSVNISAGDTLTVHGTLTLTSGNTSGSIVADGDIVLSSLYNTIGISNSSFTLSGSTAQVLESEGGTWPSGTFTINKPSGVVTLSGALTLNTAGQDLTLSGGTLNLNGNNLTVADQFVVGTGSTLRLKGSETVTGGPDTIYASSTVWYDDDAGTDSLLNVAYGNLILGSPGSATFTLPANTSIAGTLTLSGGTLDTDDRTVTVTGLTTVSGGEYQAKTGTQTFNGGLTVSGGTFTGSTGAVDVNGNLTLSSGTLTAPTGTFTVSGNWASSGGTFTPGTGTVTLDGTSQQITGQTTFANLTKTVTSADTLTFEAGETQTVTDTLTFHGAPGNLLSLRSSVDGSSWYLTPSGATRSVARLSVKDSWNRYTDLIDCVGNDCTDADGNEGWKFVADNPGGGAATTQSMQDFWETWEAEHAGGGGGGSGGGGSSASSSSAAPTAVSPSPPSPPPTYVPPPRPVRTTPLDRKALRLRRLLQRVVLTGLAPTEETTSSASSSSTSSVPAVTFRDVPKAAWYAAAVETLRARGIVEGLKTKDGSPTGLFEPARSVTHAELLKMALLAAGKNPASAKTAPANPTARGTWAAPYVAMAEDLKLSLFAYGQISPVHAPATRAQAIQTLVDLFAPDAPGSGTFTFTDLPSGHPNRQAIAVAFKLGWVRGDTDERGFPTGTFRPSDTISRAEVAKILASILKGRL